MKQAQKSLYQSARRILVTCAIVLAVFISSLQHFVLHLPIIPGEKPKNIDGIVVITGGQQRLDAGLSLLTGGTASKLLVSGVGEGVSKTILANELNFNPVQKSFMTCCVELEFVASDTRGNAYAARQWAQTNKFSSLYLVTANYHMPRAKLVFQQEMPNIALSYWPVNPDDLDLDGWWTELALIRLLAREYVKYLAEFIQIG